MLLFAIMNRWSFSASSVLTALAAVALLGSAARAEEPPSAKTMKKVSATPSATPSVAPAPLTRAEFAELIVKARDGDAFTFPAEPFFTDVPAGDPRFKYVQKFRADKLTMAEGSLGATTAVTRYMLASFVVRARFGEDFDYPKKALFSDVPESHANFKYVQKAVAAGFLSGCEKGTFCPDQVVSPDEGRRVVKAALPQKK
jgi:hypothetical protein